MIDVRRRFRTENALVPMTFPSHAAAVVPLKLWRRRWFDGVALVIGSAAPDFPYSLDPYLHYNAHTWTGLVLFCVPVTAVLAALTRRAAPAVVAHVPSRRFGLRQFALRDYAVLAARRHPWYSTALSAWLGAASHRLWDMVTHASIDGGAIRFAVLSTEAFAGQPWWRVLHYGSTLVGAGTVLMAARYIGRTGWLLDGGPAPVLPPTRPRLFWGVAAAVWLPGLAVQPFLAWFTEPQAIVVRLLEVGCLGLLAAGAAAVAARCGKPAMAAGDVGDCPAARRG